MIEAIYVRASYLKPKKEVMNGDEKTGKEESCREEIDEENQYQEIGKMLTTSNWF